MKHEKKYEISLYRYMALVLCSLSSFFLGVIFFTGDLYESSFFLIKTPPGPIKNVAGYIGSSCFAALHYFFGSAAMLFIPLLLYGVFFVIRKKHVRNEWDILSGYMIFIIACTMYGALYKLKLFSSPFCFGGVVGNHLCCVLFSFFDAAVVKIVVLGLIISGFILMSRLWPIIAVVYSFRLAKNNRLHAFLKAVVRCFKILIWDQAVWFCMYLKTLWDGSIIEQSGQSVREFEFDQFLQTLSNEHISDDHTEEEKDYFESVIVEKSIPKNSAMSSYQLPPHDLWKKNNSSYDQVTQHKQQELVARILEEKLERFGVKGSVVSIKVGPVVTLFEYQPHIDAKLSKILCLEDDLALALQALSIRIIAPIPGKSVVGFEVANKIRSTVLFATLVQTADFVQSQARLPLILGVSTTGAPLVEDLVTMPHILLAGATGSGKSVALNAMLMSLLCSRKPEELKVILIDPKRLEFAPYADIAHLLFPIVTDAHEATRILRWVVKNMEERYQLLAHYSVRTIADYHKLTMHDPTLEKMPFMVVIIDELADLMMVTGKDIEESVTRITQMARAAGIHLIVATQRPSVDVITGTIKVNFPARLSCKVSSKIDSRTILDCIGAEKLLGKGDMLYLDGSSSLRRIHGVFVCDEEIKTTAAFIRSQEKVVYKNIPENDELEDDFLVDDKHFVQEVISYIQTLDEISISLLQRRFRIGYNRSARIIEYLEGQGLIMTLQGGKTRKVIKTR